MMSAATDWLTRSMWAARSPEFGDLSTGFESDGQPIVTMQFDSRPHEAAPLWQNWIANVRHRSVIPAIEPGVLRYTAINWRHTKGGWFFAGDRYIASLGLELVSIYKHVHEVVGREDASWFANPLVKIDLEDCLRRSTSSPRSPPTRPTICEPEPSRLGQGR